MNMLKVEVSIKSRGRMFMKSTVKPLDFRYGDLSTEDALPLFLD
jgi:hypothetical protein